jgi:3-oxoacyl-[acyl-carrier protein] reductase
MSNVKSDPASIRKALVTGSSRGIGLSIAKVLASHGVDICITGRNYESLLEAKRHILDYVQHHCDTPECGLVFPIQVDLGLPETPAILMDKTIESLGGLDLLVNNAGISLSTPLEETTIKQWNTIMAINARAPYFLCKQALPYLRNSISPTIVQIASVVAYEGYVDQSAYTASKHALLGFTKSLAKEVHEDGIRIHTISPGGVATDMIGAVRPDIDTSVLIDPDEIAQMVWFLVSHRGNAMVDHVAIHRSSKLPWT